MRTCCPGWSAFCESLGYSVSFESIDGPGRRLVRPPRRSGSSSTADVAPQRAVAHARARDRARARRRLSSSYSREQSEVLADTISLRRPAPASGSPSTASRCPYVAGWGEDGALDAVTAFATTIDTLARRIEDALTGDPTTYRAQHVAPTESQRSRRRIAGRGDHALSARRSGRRASPARRGRRLGAAARRADSRSACGRISSSSRASATTRCGCSASFHHGLLLDVSRGRRGPPRRAH